MCDVSLHSLGVHYDPFNLVASHPPHQVTSLRVHFETFSSTTDTSLFSPENKS